MKGASHGLESMGQIPRITPKITTENYSRIPIKDDTEPEPPPRRKQRSQIGTVYDILIEAKEPLYLTEIIMCAKRDFNMVMEPESLVSALTKKVNSGKMFRRVAPIL